MVAQARALLRSLYRWCPGLTAEFLSTMLNYAVWPKWRNGRRAGLKIRSSQEGVGSSPTFGNQGIRLPAEGVALAALGGGRERGRMIA